MLSILGELDSISADNFSTNGSVAYVSQESYCFNGTIRQNILFGKPFDESLYRRIIYVCALEEDMKQFSAGDQTLVGERGVTLSGGQKARISLARYPFIDHLLIKSTFFISLFDIIIIVHSIRTQISIFLTIH